MKYSVNFISEVIQGQGGAFAGCYLNEENFAKLRDLQTAITKYYPDDITILFQRDTVTYIFHVIDYPDGDNLEFTYNGETYAWRNVRMLGGKARTDRTAWAELAILEDANGNPCISPIIKVPD